MVFIKSFLLPSAIHFVLDWVMLCEEFHGLLIFKSSLMQFHTSLPFNFIHLHKP